MSYIQLIVSPHDNTEILLAVGPHATYEEAEATGKRLLSLGADPDCIGQVVQISDEDDALDFLDEEGILTEVDADEDDGEDEDYDF